MEDATDTAEPTGLTLTQLQCENLLAYLKGEKYDEAVIADIRRALEEVLA